eukprot:jgi/Picre1/31592/NNA_006944.t1
MSETLRVLLLELFDEYMTSDGRLVDYTGMRLDDKFRIYVDATVDLQAVDLGGMSMQEAMCFWINMYNSLIVHAVCVFGPATSTLERLTWFDKVSYNIGGHRFSANDIEHGILRSNAPSPASVWSILGISRLAKPIFANEKDPRVQYIMLKVDPRIHFALNCGARSCPPIKVFSVDSLNDGLEAATEAFCEGEVRFDENTRELYLSSIFKCDFDVYYAKDVWKNYASYMMLSDSVTADAAFQKEWGYVNTGNYVILPTTAAKMFMARWLESMKTPIPEQNDQLLLAEIIGQNNVAENGFQIVQCMVRDECLSSVHRQEPSSGDPAVMAVAIQPC